MAVIEFAENYEDCSSAQGYQFNFLCNRCGNAYQSNFVPANVSVAGGFLRVASGLLNKGGAGQPTKAPGLFSGGAHEKALQNATEQMRSCFIQCPQCHTWVCRDICWNIDAGICKNCAPIPGEDEELARRLMPREPSFVKEIEREREIEEPEASEETPEVVVEEPKPVVAKNGATKPQAQASVTCTQCGVALAPGAKFCSECGTPQKANCAQCGVTLAPGAKFCSECGTRV